MCCISKWNRSKITKKICFILHNLIRCGITYVLWQNKENQDDPAGCTQSNLHDTFCSDFMAYKRWHTKNTKKTRTHCSNKRFPRIQERICVEILLFSDVFCLCEHRTKLHKELFKVINQNYVAAMTSFSLRQRAFIHANPHQFTKDDTKSMNKLQNLNELEHGEKCQTNMMERNKMICRPFWISIRKHPMKTTKFVFLSI